MEFLSSRGRSQAERRSALDEAGKIGLGSDGDRVFPTTSILGLGNRGLDGSKFEVPEKFSDGERESRGYGRVRDEKLVFRRLKHS